MPLSYQTVVSDGTLTSLALTINYFEQDDITIFYDDVEIPVGSGWNWLSPTSNTILFTPVVANGVEVRALRNTDTDHLRHDFSSGAKFNSGSVDENYLQALYAVQEAKEGALIGNIFFDIDMHGHKITGLKDATALDGAATYKQVLESGGAGTFAPFTFNGDGVTTSFTLGYAPTSENNTEAHVDGVYQTKDTYSVVGAIITFSEAPATGTNNVEVMVQSTLPQGATDSAASSFMQDGAGALLRTTQDELREIKFLSDYSTQGAAIAAAAGKRLMVGAGESVIVNVPADFSTIALAWSAIAGWVIASTGTVTIQVADGTYNLTASLLLNHPFGGRIRLVGNETTPANCLLQVVNPGFDCILVTDGNRLSYLNGFKVYKTVKALAADNTTGVLALRGSSIVCGTKMIVDNWYYSVAARDGSFMYAPSIVSDHAGDVGIWAFRGSEIDCPNAVVTTTSDSVNSLGWGIQAEYGSTIGCQGATTSGCYMGGIAAKSNSTVRAQSAITQNNTGFVSGAHGLYAENGGTIVANSAQTLNNTGYGIYLGDVAMGAVTGSGITNTGNASGTIGISAALDVTAGVPRVLLRGPTGARIENANAASVLINTSGGSQFEVAHTANAVNRLRVAGGAVGNKVSATAIGTDTNIRAAFGSKGAEVTALESNGVPAFQAFNATGSEVNFGQVDGSTTGNAVIYKARGSDTNIHLNLSPKGTGVVMLDDIREYADDTAASAGGVPVKGMYKTGSVLKIRVT